MCQVEFPESQDEILVLTVLFVPSFLDSGVRNFSEQNQSFGFRKAAVSQSEFHLSSGVRWTACSTHTTRSQILNPKP